MEPLSISNFFSEFYILHPDSGKALDKLTEKEQKIALAVTIILGLLTFGLVHAGFAIAERWCIKPIKEGNEREETIGEEARDKMYKGKSPIIQHSEGTKSSKGTSSEQGDLHIPSVKLPSFTSLVQPPPAQTEALKEIPQQNAEEEKILFSWKRESSITSPAILLFRKPTGEFVQISNLNVTNSFTPPSLWVLESDGKLDSQNPQAEKEFLEALHFLARNPVWVKESSNKELVIKYFSLLAKTDFSRSNQLNEILFIYQDLWKQHEAIFLDLEKTQECSPFIVSMKMGDEEKKIPKNMLVSQSPVFQRMLEGPWKKEFLVDFDQEENDIKEQFDLLVSYFLKGEISISGDNVLAMLDSVLTLLDYAHKNHVSHLEEGCMQFLEQFSKQMNKEQIREIFVFLEARGLGGPFLECVSTCVDSENFTSFMHMALELNDPHLISAVLRPAAEPQFSKHMDQSQVREIFGFLTERGLVKSFIEGLSPCVEGENFVSFMRMALELNIPHLIWAGLRFAAELPEDPYLKDFSSRLNPLHWSRSSQDKEIVRLIELGAECHGKIAFDVSSRDQTNVCLIYDNKELNKSEKSKVWELLKTIHSLVPIEGFDTGHALTRGEISEQHTRDFIQKMVEAFPDLKEVKILLPSMTNQTIDFANPESLLSHLLINLIQIEGIGLSFPFDKELTKHYVDLFNRGDVKAQSGRPIHLRSLFLANCSSDEAGEFLKKTPHLGELAMSNCSGDSFSYELPLLDTLQVNDCEALKKIKSQTVKNLKISNCNNLGVIDAPRAKRLEAGFNRNLNIERSSLDQVEYVSMGYCGNRNVLYFPSAKRLAVVGVLSTKEIKVPEDCCVVAGHTEGVGLTGTQTVMGPIPKSLKKIELGEISVVRIPKNTSST